MNIFDRVFPGYRLSSSTFFLQKIKKNFYTGTLYGKNKYCYVYGFHTAVTGTWYEDRYLCLHELREEKNVSTFYILQEDGSVKQTEIPFVITDSKTFENFIRKSKITC